MEESCFLLLPRRSYETRSRALHHRGQQINKIGECSTCQLYLKPIDFTGERSRLWVFSWGSASTRVQLMALADGLGIPSFVCKVTLVVISGKVTSLFLLAQG